MLGTKFDPQLFFQRADNVALNVPASELFSLLKRSLDLPPAWGASVTRDTGDHLVTPAGASVEGSDAAEVFFVRVTPVDVTLNEKELSTKDGHLCEVDLRLRIRVVPERSELLSFKRLVLGSRRVVQAEAISRYLQPAIRSAIGTKLGENDAAALGDRADNMIADVVKDAVQGPCFSAGLLLDSAPTVRLESRSLRDFRKTKETAALRLAEHEAGGDLRRAIQGAQREHLGHLSTVLTRLRELTASQPGVALADLIRTFAEPQRGEIYDALLKAGSSSSPSRWIVVAVGDELLFFDPANPSIATRRIPIDGAAGPIRSVNPAQSAAGRSALWLGAATGVYRVSLDGGALDGTWLVPGVADVRGGFNAVAVVNGRILASHSELGIWEWSAADPKSARQRFESMTRLAKAVRNVQVHDGACYCAIDDRVIKWNAADSNDDPLEIYTGARATITALRVTLHGVFAGTSEGDVLVWRGGDAGEPARLHHGSRRPVESVCLMETHGVNRLVFADTTSRIHARVLNESFTWQYEAGGQVLRRVAVAADLLAAVNELRDRLFLWDPANPGQPISAIPIGTLFGRNVQDLVLLPAAAIS